MLQSQRTFLIKTSTPLEQIQEVLKYEYEPGAITLENVYILNITCDRNSGPKNLVQEDIEKILKTKAGIKANVAFVEAKDIAPKIPDDFKVYYYVEEKSKRYQHGKIRMLTQKMIDTKNHNDLEQLEMINVMLEKYNLNPDYDGTIFFFEENTLYLVENLLTEKRGFIRSMKPL